MPEYAEGGDVKPQSYNGRGAVVFNDEAIEEGMASEAISLGRSHHDPTVLSVELRFSDNPGAFQVDLQTSDTDEDVCFVTKASLTTGLNDGFVGRIEAINLVATYARLKIVALENEGYCTLTATLN